MKYKVLKESVGAEPSSVEEALNGIDSEEWKLAMKRELDALIENKTWELTPWPKGRRILKTRWVFKIKENSQDKLRQFKVRLVVRGYEQITAVDYNETFCPVVRFNTLRCLFAVAAKEDYNIDHLDVVTAFLNGELKEEVYIKFPEGLIKKITTRLVGSRRQYTV